MSLRFAGAADGLGEDGGDYGTTRTQPAWLWEIVIARSSTWATFQAVDRLSYAAGSETSARSVHTPGPGQVPAIQSAPLVRLVTYRNLMPVRVWTGGRSR
jgi:hypothetical protein